MGDAGKRPLELWVGPECTINRVGERWRDQSELTGFAHRPDDLARLASLGATRVRLPVLWERAAAAAGGALDFSASDRAISTLCDAGLQPIVGLLHHGSGPRQTSLVDPHFPVLFADYARRVAERYPQVLSWTPINEPLTTARFSCLYGLWYPHAADDRSFVRALLNQVRATVLAMQAIRAVNPRAELVQTEDLGFTRSTPALAEQAAFDNERRWLAFDLLCGRVDERHPLWDWLCGCGADSTELARLCEAPCAPGIIGINAYVTSERFLDDRLALHPPHLHGGNGRQAYVDVETVRAHGDLVDGFGGRLREAHDRYGLPLAVTEVHMGCTREEQMRWLHQAWRAAEDAGSEGVDVRGVTAWAAFGTVDWSSLLTREAGHYEPGLWDARSDPPRLTALGRLATSLARGGASASTPTHPVLAGCGWWQRDLRLEVASHAALKALPARGATLLILGDGAPAHAFARLAHMRGLPYECLAGVDDADPGVLSELLRTHDPWAVVDAGSDDDIDALDVDAARLQRMCQGRARLAASCAQRSIRLLNLSTDQVFAGHVHTPRVESDACDPASAYGRARRHGEEAVSRFAPHALIIRAGAVFGPWDPANFVTRGMAALGRGERWAAASEQVVSPTYLPDLVQAALDLLIDDERGVWHLSNGEPQSWADFAGRAARHARLDPRLVVDVANAELPRGAKRPAFCALASERGALLPSLDDALARYQRDHEPVPSEPPPLRAVA